MIWRLGLAIVWLCSCAIANARYATVWTDEATLWLHAVQIAPEKPRPHTQLAIALIERRRFAEAALVLDDTERLITTCAHIPLWDRVEAAATVRQQRHLLARLIDRGPSRLGWTRSDGPR